MKALKEAPERTERKPRRNSEENKNKSNVKAKRKVEKKESENDFGDTDLNNNIGFAIEEVLSGIEIEDSEDSIEE